jgi:hypothetical protein
MGCGTSAKIEFLKLEFRFADVHTMLLILISLSKNENQKLLYFINCVTPSHPAYSWNASNLRGDFINQNRIWTVQRLLL